MFHPSSSIKKHVVNVLFIGIGGYGSISALYWLVMGLLVSLSYCSSARHHSAEQYRSVCGMPLYPKWEYLSWRYTDELKQSLQTVTDNGCLAEDTPVRLKVMDYQPERAIVWYQGESGSKWLARFQRHPQTNTWTVFDPEQQVCQVDIIASKMGGSADDIFWY